MNQLTQVESARAFARSLNILLKYVRLYGLGHLRTRRQLTVAWDELKRAVAPETGLLLGTASGKLVVDGMPLEGLSEHSFAALLNSAGIASVHFTSTMKQDDFIHFVGAFCAGKPSEVGEQLKTNFGENSGIRVNELRFVAQDSSNMAEELAARSLGDKALVSWLHNPEKLLQLIAAAQGSLNPGSNGQGEGAGAANSGAGPGSGDDATAVEGAGPAGTGGGAAIGWGNLTEESVNKALRLLATMATLKSIEGEAGDTVVLSEMAKDGDATDLLRRVMLSLPLEDEAAEGPTLAKLAERLAIRFALQQYERGDVKVNAVHELMERMGKEIDALRSVLEAHETKMSRAGMAVESYADVLDRKFWASVPEQGKKSVLLSPDMYCIPARNVRSYVEDLLARGDHTLATQILRNCLRQLSNEDLDARRKTSATVSELADLFSKVGEGLLVDALRQVGMRICTEASLEMQTLLGAAYVRLTQEAALQRDYAAVMQSLNTMERLQEYRPRTAMEVKPRVTVDNRVRGFIADAVQEPIVPDGLAPLLARVPQATAHEMAILFIECTLRSQADRFIELARAAGNNVIECLTGTMRAGVAGEVIGTAALLSRLRPEVVATELPGRIKTFSRPQQDAIVRALAAAGSAERGRMLLDVLPEIDPLLLPEALDEIGFSGDSSASAPLMQMAAGEGLAKDRPLVRLKAIEALGRVGTQDATSLLDEMVAPKGFFAARRSHELQLTAARALVSLDPERLPTLYARGGIGPQELAVGALAPAESDWVRQRRYPRVEPKRGINALAITPKGKCSVDVQRLSLGGGLISSEHRLPRGGEAMLEWQNGLYRLRSHVVLRHMPTKELAFEVLDIDMDGRGRLRKMVMDHAPAGMPDVSAASALA